MTSKTFSSAKVDYKITVNPGPRDGKKYPVIMLVHGNLGLNPPYGDEIRNFALALSGRGYVTAVPQYYADDKKHLDDTVPHVQTLSDAIAHVGALPGADASRIGLIGYSLGAATAMSYIASKPAGTIKAFADFFGFLTPAIRAGISKFPPTIIFHNKNDVVVSVENSKELDRLLPKTIIRKFVSPYDERSDEFNHAFKPNGPADVNSRAEATDWLVKHLPPLGK